MIPNEISVGSVKNSNSTVDSGYCNTIGNSKVD